MKKLILSISTVLVLTILVVSGNYIFAREKIQDYKPDFIKSDKQNKGEVRGVYSERMETETYYSPQGILTLEEAYTALGLIVYPEDKVWVFPDPSLGVGSHIDIIRAPILYIDDGGTKWIGRSWQETIADYMHEIGLALNPNDEVTPHPGSLIKSGMQVSIKRVTKSTFKENVTVSYTTKYYNDNTLEKGKYETVQEGKNGKKEVIYQITTENGKEVHKEVISETILQNVQNKVIARGTKILYKYIGSGSSTFVNGYPSNTCAFRGYYGRYLRVTNNSNGKSVVVKVVDWGPAPWTGHLIDLSSDAFSKLAPLGAGIIKNVKVELVLN